MDSVQPSRVCVVRSAGPRPSWQTVCADCGPLDIASGQVEAVEMGRAHLHRSHGGGQMAVGLGPYSDVGGVVDSNLSVALDDLAGWFAAPDGSAEMPPGLTQLCRAVLSASGRVAPFNDPPPRAS
jgi:hypothetical protein